jgi:ribonuclease HI
MIVELYTDGACRGNPGVGGWGVLLKHTDIQHELFGYEEKTTNNRMELMAAIQGIKAVEISCQEIVVYTDSQYVCRGITDWLSNWKKNGWKTAARKPVKNDDLWRSLDDLCNQYTVKWCWVKGHSGNQGNERADALANLAIDKFLSSENTLKY